MTPWELAIRRPVTVTMLMLVVLLLGAVSLGGLRLDLLPRINAPVAVVFTSFRGASAEEVASLVTVPLEGAASTAPDVKEVTSYSMEGQSVVVARFEWGADMTTARQELAERIERVPLPDDAGRPLVAKFDPTQAPIMEVAVSSASLDLATITGLVTEVLRPRLETVPGVATVELTGGLEREIQVNLDREAMARLGLDQARIAAVVQASNLNWPAGRVRSGDLSPAVRVTGALAGAEAVADLVITYVPDAPATPAGPVATPAAGPPTRQEAARLRPVRLGEVARMEEGFADRSSVARINGRPSVGLALQKDGDANTVVVARAIRQELERLRREHPELDLRVVNDTAAFIETSLQALAAGLLQGGAIAVAVLFLFLRSLRSTLIIALSIPFSVVATFVLLYFRGLTLNIMTLGALALGVGMLVDSAIVVIEAIYRHLRGGMVPEAAARMGTGEVGMAITASILTTVAVFLPVVYVRGLTGELFRELALTVTFSLLASLVVATTVIPMLAFRLLRAAKGGSSGPVAALDPPGGSAGQFPPRRLRRRARAADREFGLLQRAYGALLGGALRRRWLVLALAAASLAGSLALASSIGTEFLPTVDEGVFSIELRMPAGTPLETTVEAVGTIERALAGLPEVDTVMAVAGTAEGMSAFRSGIGIGGPEVARVLARLVPEGERERSTAEVMAAARASLAEFDSTARLGFNLESSLLAAGVGGANLFQLLVAAPDRPRLDEAVGQIVDALAELSGLVSLESNLDARKPELQLVIDQQAALARGLTRAQVALAAAHGVRGHVVTRLAGPDGTVPVRVRYREEDRRTVDDLRLLVVGVTGQRPVRLGEVADIRDGLGQAVISRQDQREAAVLTGLIEGRDLGSVTREALARIDGLGLTDGVSVETSGVARLMAEGFRDLQGALVLAVVLVYMILAAQFESLAHPLAVLFSLPLALVGVVLGLYWSGFAFGITAYIGVIMLAGIVVNNAIVLVDYTNQLRARGLGARDALVRAGMVRLRPVLMTALTTILALAPLAVGLGAGARLQMPLGIVVIGGLTSATLLTLIVVPVAYSLVDDAQRWLGGRGAPARGATTASVEAAAGP